MGCDPFSPICQAQLNVLCVPATKLSKEHFRQSVSALQSCSLIGVSSVQHELAANDASTNLKFVDGSVLLNTGLSTNRNASADGYLINLNSQPQILLGVVSGEDIVTTSASEYQERLRAIDKGFMEYAAGYEHLMLGAIVVFGGASPVISDSCLWVDTDGQGPAVPDVLSGIIAMVYERLPTLLENLRARLIRVQQDSDILHRSPARSSTGDASDAGSSTVNGQPLSSYQDSSSRRNDQTRLSAVQGRAFTAQLLILQGLLSMQIGQWLDALRQLTQGVSAIRSQDDHLWYAKGLDGLLTCMLMLLWAHVDFTIPQICYPVVEKNVTTFSSKSMSAIILSNHASTTTLFSSTSSSPTHSLTELIPHLVSTILGLYERASNDIKDSTVIIALFEARVRWANLLITMKEYGGFLQDATLQHIVEGIHNKPQARGQVTSTSSLILRSNALCKLLIDTALDSQTRLSVGQSAAVYMAIAQALSRLQLERKQGLHLKEFLQRLGPTLAEARRLGAAEAGIHPSASLPSLRSIPNGAMEESSHGIRTLLDVVTRVYGLPVREKTKMAPERPSHARLSDALNSWAAVQTSGDLFMKLEILSLCTEISDAIPSPRDSLCFTSLLLQAAKKVMTISINNSDASPLLAYDDQTRLLQNMRKAQTTGEELGHPGIGAEFWDKFLVRNVELLEDTHTNRLIPHTARDLSQAAIGDGRLQKDPFIFNSFAKAQSANSLSVISVGELARFGVVLQNPLDVEVEVEDITLSSEGCDFTPSHHSILLGPLCCQVFILSGMPEREGELKITGCKARIRGCYEEEFMILPDDWRLPIDTKQRMRGYGLNNIPNIPMPKTKEVSLKVTKSYPSLSIVSSSLLQPSLMLLEGESTKFELVVRNESSIDIDLVLLTFGDTVKKRLEEALTNKDLSPADMYEIQYQIASRPAIIWTNAKTDLKIPTHGVENFALEIFGRPGLTDVTIMIDYAYIGKPKDELTKTFYTRQLSYNITTTVNGSVDVSRCLMLPLQNDLYWSHTSLADKSRNDRLFFEVVTNGKPNDQCILLLDIRNIWPQPLEIEFQARRWSTGDLEGEEEWEDAYTMSEFLQPGQMSRILVLVPRIFIPDPEATIPSLDTKRQYVVSASKMTAEAESASRESFWYRERLLQCLRATWKELDGQRKGKLDMRKTIRLSSRMIDALRIDQVEVSFSLRSAIFSGSNDTSNDAIHAEGYSHFRLKRNTFATLVVTIHNRSNESLRLLLRLQPSLHNHPHNVALDLSKRFAWSGVLQQALHPVLKAEESRVVELSVIALAAGSYEINATAEEIKGRKASATRSGDLMAASERRLWHARQPCLIDTIDEEES